MNKKITHKDMIRNKPLTSFVDATKGNELSVKCGFCGATFIHNVSIGTFVCCPECGYYVPL